MPNPQATSPLDNSFKDHTFMSKKLSCCFVFKSYKNIFFPEAIITLLFFKTAIPLTCRLLLHKSSLFFVFKSHIFDLLSSEAEIILFPSNSRISQIIEVCPVKVQIASFFPISQILIVVS